MGDFNGRAMALGDTVDSPQGSSLLELIGTCGLLVENPDGIFTNKRAESVLDVILASPSASERVSDWQAHDVFQTDHMGITFSYRFSPCADKSRPKIMWNFRRANWKQFRLRLEEALANWLALTDMTGALDTLYETWIECILSVAREVIPKRIVTSRSIPFVSEEFSRLAKQKKKALRRKQKQNTATIRARLREYRAAMKAEMEQAKIKALKQLLDFPVEATQHDFRDRFAKITRKVAKVSTVLRDGDEVFVSNQGKVERFN